MCFLICKSTLSENGGLGRGMKKKKFEIQTKDIEAGGMCYDTKKSRCICF
mgnify:CR=1 FL=1